LCFVDGSKYGRPHYFFWREILAFLLGILRKRRVWVWFLGGENVVKCVVNVVFWQSLFQWWKMRQVLGIYFSGFPFWDPTLE
jgi:hypothetical protein